MVYNEAIHENIKRYREKQKAINKEMKSIIYILWDKTNQKIYTR